MRVIALVPFYFGPHQALLAPLAEMLTRSCRARVDLHPPRFDPEAAFDVSRGQYHSTQLIQTLLEHHAPGMHRVVGITGADLFIPVLTYVFGEAQLDGQAAVVSCHRLRNEVYGLPANDALLQDRLNKEILHELGHTYGLTHCLDGDCVMHASTYVEDIDLKRCTFCPACEAHLP